MRPQDLRIDVFRSGTNCPVHVKITHLPTGLSAQATDRSQLRAREAAMRELSERPEITEESE